MKNLFVPTVLVLGLVFGSCEKDNSMEMNPRVNDIPISLKSQGVDMHSSETGSLSGNVYFAGCKVPVQGVCITIDESSVFTGPDGSYTLKGIPAGARSLVACKDDFESCCKEVLIVKDIEENLPVYLTSKQFSTQVSGNLTGDYTGKAMSNLKVVVLNPDGSESGLKAVTGFNGSYSLSPVPQGERTVIVKMNNDEIFRQDIQLEDLEEAMSLDNFREYGVLYNWTAAKEALPGRMAFANG